MKISSDKPGPVRLIEAFLCALFVFSFSLAEGMMVSPETGSPFSVSDSTYRRVIRDGARSMSCYLNYPQGSAKVQPDYRSNGEELDKLDRFIRQVFRDSLIYVDSICLSGYCSIEGAFDVNDRLARNRATGFRKYLDDRYGLSSRYPVRITWVAEDWDGLRGAVEASRMNYRDEVLFLIDQTGVFEGREKKLMDLGGGEPYAYMLKEFFPGLRRVEITVSYDLRRIMEEKLHRKLDEAEFETALSKERAAAEAEERRLAELERQKQQAQQAAEQAARMAAERAALAERQRQREAEQARMEAQRQAAEAARLQAEREAAEAARLQRQEERKLYPLAGVKTNLLAWTGLLPDFKTAAFMPNLEAEFYFAGRWSVSASALYADWEYGGGKQFWGISSYSMEPRFWFRDDGLFRGFFVGVYGEAGDFNDQKDRRDDAATATNYTGTFWSAGVSAGYLLPLSRHWGLELSLRVGYRGAKYDVYDRELPYLYYNYSDKENKFTLTGLRLNVVYRFGHGRP